jgi:hypothetical protein
MATLEALIDLSDAELAKTDPLAMNLTVAREIPRLARLDIEHYRRTVNGWALDLARRLPGAEMEFRKTPQDWRSDLAFFRLGFLCWYVDEVLGIRYREDQKKLLSVFYPDPCDLFLNGVIDTRRGTCGNMSALHVAVGWRLGWPVSLACARWHILCRYDDGKVTHNIEATNNGQGGFSAPADAYYRKEYGIPEWAVRSGSDLAALRPRELLGLFVSLRARHRQDCGDLQRGLEDYRLAHRLFPNNRLIAAKSTDSIYRYGQELPVYDVRPAPVLAASKDKSRGVADASAIDQVFARYEEF